MPDVKRVVLAYSGGLDTSVILRWLIETYECEVIAYCADLGQGEELIPIRDKALKTGASEVHVADLREEFVSQYLWRMVRAGDPRIRQVPNAGYGDGSIEAAVATSTGIAKIHAAAVIVGRSEIVKRRTTPVDRSARTIE